MKRRDVIKGVLGLSAIAATGIKLEDDGVELFSMAHPVPFPRVPPKASFKPPVRIAGVDQYGNSVSMWISDISRVDEVLIDHDKYITPMAIINA